MTRREINAGVCVCRRTPCSRNDPDVTVRMSAVSSSVCVRAQECDMQHRTGQAEGVRESVEHETPKAMRKCMKHPDEGELMYG